MGTTTTIAGSAESDDEEFYASKMSSTANREQGSEHLLCSMSKILHMLSTAETGAKIAVKIQVK